MAHVITTHGIPMGKAAYLCHNVLGGLQACMAPPGTAAAVLGSNPKPHCGTAYTALQSLEGLGSFLAAQVVADLKNTVGYPLYYALDKATFVAHGPGSIRGLQWFWNEPTISASSFYRYFASLILMHTLEHYPHGRTH